MRHFELLAALACTSALACSAILGLKEPTIDDTIGGDAANVDAAVDGDAAVNTTPLVSGTQVRHIALDDTTIFYTAPIDTFVARIEKDGTGQLNLGIGASSTGFHPDFVQVDATDVFWQTAGGLYQCKKTGCSSSPTRLVDDQDADAAVAYSISAFAVDDQSTVYFGDSPTSGVAIRSVPKGAARGTVTTILTESQFSVCPTLSKLTYDSGFLYFACGEGSVGRITPATAAIEVFTNSAPPPSAYDFVVYGSTIFYTQEQPAGALYSLPLVTGSTSTPLVIDQNSPFAIANDTQYIYWTALGAKFDGTDGALLRCKQGTCSSSVESLVFGLDGPTDVRVDQTNIYFAEYGGGSGPAKQGIFRLAKP